MYAETWAAGLGLEGAESKFVILYRVFFQNMPSVRRSHADSIDTLYGVPLFNISSKYAKYRAAALGLEGAES